jgi:lysophospholipase L1-like esterase
LRWGLPFICGRQESEEFVMTPRAIAACALLSATFHTRACGPTSCARGGSTSSQETPREAGAPVVAVLGSSTAAGHGLDDPSQSWVGRYAAHLSATHGLRVQNLAVDGHTTFHVLPTGTARLPGRPAVDEAHNVTAALAFRPKAIIVNLPTNDAAMGVSVEESIRNIRTVVAKAGEAGVPVWVSTPQPRVLDGKGSELLAGMRDGVKREFADHALDFWTPLAGADGKPLPAYNQGDGIHPNASGHRLLFEQVKLADIPRAIDVPR